MQRRATAAARICGIMRRAAAVLSLLLAQGNPETLYPCTPERAGGPGSSRA